MFLHTWGEQHGVCFVARSLQGQKIMHFSCARAGKYKDTRKIADADRERVHPSYKTGCRAQFWVHRQKDESWTIRHSLGDNNFIHNHKPNAVGQLTASQRKMERSDALKDMVHSHAVSGINVKNSKRLVNGAFPEAFQTKSIITT